MGVIQKLEQIVQDVHKAVRAMETMDKTNGAFVPGLAGGCVPGHHYRTTTKNMSNNHGGKRDKLEFNLALKEKEMHAGLKSILADPEQDLMGMFRMQVDE